MTLPAFGWDAEWQAAYLAAALSDSRPARIVRVDRGECTVVTEQGYVRALSDSTRAQGAIAPVTGDWVVLTDDEEAGARIATVLPRRHTLVRRDPSEKIIEQVLVANVDRVLIVHGRDRPLPPGRLERLLVMAWDCGAQPIVVLSKADLEDDRGVRDVARALAAPAPIIEVSRVDGRGVLELRAQIPSGITAALIGESGAGKSNLVNLIVGEAVQATGKVRDRDAKGRHTTVAREMHRVRGGGVVIDTPGIRMVGLFASEDALHRVFSDIDQLGLECRFKNCSHDREPDCAVQRAMQEGRLDPRRLDRYRALADEIAASAGRERTRAKTRRR
jgi:ribosome biogenesis GTPase